MHTKNQKSIYEALSISLLSLMTFSPFCLRADLSPVQIEENIHVSSQNAGHEFFSEPQVGNFKPEMLHLVDQKNNVYFFRGNLPEQDHVFIYDTLISDIKDYLANQGMSLGSNYKLLDVSLLNFFREKKALDGEKEWFHKHKDTGRLLIHSIYGSLTNPVHLSEEIRNDVLRHYDMDGLKSLMKHLEKMMNEQHSHDLIIYVHCEAGKDRTGAVAACYLMQYKGYSYNQVISLDNQIAGRDIEVFCVNAIRWYAFYLRDVLNISSVGTIE